MDLGVSSRFAVLAVRAAVPASFGKELSLVAERRKPVKRTVGDQDDVSSPAAITAIRAAAGHELLAAEADEAVSTIATPDPDISTVDHGDSFRLMKS